MRPLEIAAGGIASSLGLSWASTCAAARCGLMNAQETHFLDGQGKPVRGCLVPLDEDERGLEKLVRLLAMAVQECAAAADGHPLEDIPVLVCVSEPDRPGRFDRLDGDLLPELARSLGKSLARGSALVPRGRAGFAHALREAERLIHEQREPWCIVAGVDTLVAAETLAEYEARYRLLTWENSNGFLAGEAGGAVLLCAPRRAAPRRLVVAGVGMATEKASIESGQPLRGEGLSAAIRAALADSGRTYDDVHYRISDANGEQYTFRETSLALTRTLRTTRPAFPLWTPADTLGEVGAAAGPCFAGIALAASRKRYAPGPGVLVQLANDGGERAALVLREI